MLRSITCVFLLLFSASFVVVGQKHCECIVDTTRILLNTDLNYFIFGLQNETFRALSKKEDIPKFVLDQLDCLTRGFSLANPDQNFRCCCTSSQKLPKRKLLYLAESRDMLVMTYLTGGIAVQTHLLMIKFTQQRINKLWAGFGDENLRSPKEIANYIEKNRNKNWGLNTNIVFL